jgi:hypothetical protein
MPAVTLKAHFNGQQIVLDEPFALPPDSQLMVTFVPQPESADDARDDRSARGGDRELPEILPKELAPLANAIEHSKAICRHPPEPGDDSALGCSTMTWDRATQILIQHALAVWEKAKVAIRVPAISAGPEGSVDLYWTAAPHGLLLNVPADPQQPPTFYGDDASNPGSNRTAGTLDPSQPVDVGVLMWLAHTAGK